MNTEKELNRLIALKEALLSDEGICILNAMKDFMVELSGMQNANPEWIKGVGLLICFLKETEQRLERFKERS